MDYREPIARRERNFVFTKAGSVWANYVLTGAAMDLYSTGSPDAVRRVHASLYAALNPLEIAEFSLGGFLTNVPTQDRLNAIIDGLPNISADEYPEMAKTLTAHNQAIASGRLPSRKRTYILSVRLAGKTSTFGRLASRLFDVDPFADTDDNELSKFDREVMHRIPSLFQPRPAQPEDLDWVHDRALTRGLWVPTPAPVSDRRVVSQPNAGFANYEVDTNPDGEATLSEFASRYDDDDAPGARDSLLGYFRSLRYGRALGIRNVDRATPELPDGPISYQTVFAISRYPSTPDSVLRGFTSIVDLATGLDGDFMHRFVPRNDLRNTKRLNKNVKEITAEADANVESELDVDRYAEDRNEVRQFNTEIRHDPIAEVFTVTTLFAFGAPRLDTLRRLSGNVRSMFESAGYQTFTPVGGALELWEAMFPCSPRTTIIDDLAGTTTASRMGAFAPVREHRVGDAIGIPFATVIDDANGKDVLLDLLNATERGNASMAFTGAQGRGKSHAMKQIVSWLNDLRKTAYILDGQGEWASFAQQFESHQVVDIARPKYSLDPFKLFPLDHACTVAQDLLLPLLGLRADSEAGAAVAEYISPAYMETRRLTTMRQLLESILRDGNRSELRSAMAAIKQIINTRMMDAFVDPVIGDRVTVIPPVELDARIIVFYTKGLSLPDGSKEFSDMTLPERYALMANTAVARITSWKFNQIKDICAFVLDEASFYDDLDVLGPLIKEPDRAGRKAKNLVIAGSQTGEEFNKPQYKLIRRRFCMGQDTPENAAEALSWAGFTPSPRLVEALIYETSPLDASRNNMPIPGREGECYFNDGTTKAKIKVLPIFREDRRRLATTRASEYIHYDGSEA